MCKHVADLGVRIYIMKHYAHRTVLSILINNCNIMDLLKFIPCFTPDAETTSLLVAHKIGQSFNKQEVSECSNMR